MQRRPGQLDRLSEHNYSSIVKHHQYEFDLLGAPALGVHLFQRPPNTRLNQGDFFRHQNWSLVNNSIRVARQLHVGTQLFELQIDGLYGQIDVPKHDFPTARRQQRVDRQLTSVRRNGLASVKPQLVQLRLHLLSLA